MTDEFYVYIHCKPDGEIFYVGKGVRRRAYEFRGRSKHHMNVVAKYGKQNITVQIIARTHVEQDALDWEVMLIQNLGHGHALVNLTNGGEGVSGYRHTDRVIIEQQTRMVMMRDSLSEKALRKYEVEGARDAASERQARVMTPHRKEVHSKTMSAVYSTDEGRKMQAERSIAYWGDHSSKLKQSLLTRDFLADPLRKTEWVESIKKGWTAEKRKAQSDRAKIRFSDPAERLKLSEARKTKQRTVAS